MRREDRKLKNGRVARRVRFDSLPDLAAWSEANRVALAAHEWNIDDDNASRRVSWYGGANAASTHALLTRGGDAALATDVSTLLGSLRLPDTERLTIQPVLDVAGGVPIIANVLAGDPLCMVDVQDTPDSRAPINVYVDLSSSASIDATHLRKRGACCVALLQVLQRLRPVKLWAYAGTAANITSCERDGVAIMVPLSTPLSLAEAGLAFCHTGFVRGLLYSCARVEAGFVTAWPFSAHGDEAIRNAAETLLEPVPGDVIVTGMNSFTDAYRDPIAWLFARLTEAGVDVSQLIN